MNLEQRSRNAHELASQRAKDDPLWNERYVSELEAIGFELVPIDDDTQLGKDGPLVAPAPSAKGRPYPYPSVIAPRGWHPAAWKADTQATLKAKYGG